MVVKKSVSMLLSSSSHGFILRTLRFDSLTGHRLWALSQSLTVTRKKKKKTDFIKLRLCETRSLNQTKPLVSRSLNVTVISD